MKVCGFSSSTRSPPIDASASSPLKRLRNPAAPVPSGNRINRHEADVVTVAGVAGTRIAETDNKRISGRSRTQHRRGLEY